jgi:hypothetical protein
MSTAILQIKKSENKSISRNFNKDYFLKKSQLRNAK